MFNYLEKNMTPYFENWLDIEGYHVRKEVATREGICDLVGCKFDESKVKIRKDLSLYPHMTSEMQIAAWFAYMGQKNYAYFVEPELLKKEHQKLSKKGFIAKDSDEPKSKNKWFPLVKQIVSIELKLKNFGDAFAQAIRYSYHSNLTFIGMPLEVCKKLNDCKMALLKEHGIGLLAFDMDSEEVIQKIKPKHKALNSIEESSRITHARIAELFWKDLQTI